MGRETRDPDEILGVAKTASAVEFKSAFRKLAKKYQPDQSKVQRRKIVSRRSDRPTILGDDTSVKRLIAARSSRTGSRARQFEGFGPSIRGPRVAATSRISASISAQVDLRQETVQSIRHILAELFGAGRSRARSQAATGGEDIAVSVAVF